MSQLSKSSFDTQYANASGSFLTNGLRLITGAIMRAFSLDVKESVLFYEDDYLYYLKTTTASGTNTYTITDTIPAAYTSGERFLITFTNANTGASTLNRNGLGAKDLKTVSGSALSSGQIVAGGKYIVVYNGTYYMVLNLDISGMTNPMTTGGDIIYGGASGVPTRLANGSAGQVLTSGGGTAAPTWGALTAGTYTPTVTNVTNTSGLTAYESNYIRVGSIVTVSGMITFSVTAAVATDVSITLPVSSDFAGAPDGHGTGFSDGKDQGCILYADSASNLMYLHFVAKGTGSHDFRYTFMYEII